MSTTPDNTTSIIVHGGAWAIPDSQKAASRSGVEAAALAGQKVLLAGGSSLDAVEAAVRQLESDATFDAGHGSCLNAARGVEMDASIMTDTKAFGVQAGAVAAVSRARHPISLARAVMEHTPHVLLVGVGADRFAKEVDAEIVDGVEELVTREAVEEWERFERYGAAVEELFNRGAGRGHDTVGAVARDGEGRLACATSTGGITFKRVGRVGDSPVVGAGLFCERGVGACSTTGHGESILKVGLARLAVLNMEFLEMDVWRAVEKAVERMRGKTGGCGGVVMLDANGEWARAFSTERMAWACIAKDGVLRSGIDPGEVEEVSMCHGVANGNN